MAGLVPAIHVFFRGCSKQKDADARHKAGHDEWRYTMSEKELAGKVAIVTGAGRNIGRAIALALGHAGAAVVLNVRSNKSEADSVVQEIETAGGKAFGIVGDVADEKTASALANAALKRFGRIDILVNNAAVRREKPITDMSYAEWREVMGVILDGAFRCVHACLPA